MDLYKGVPRMTTTHIVVARYKEDLSWLIELLKRHDSFKATVINDGNPITNIPQEVSSRITVKPGDKVPHEATKYAKFIIDNWNDIINDDTLTRYIFLQGDPVYHNHTLLNCFDYIDDWNIYYQNLALYAHPPPWGCAKAINNKTIPGITEFSKDAMVWCDKMDVSFQGLIFYDPFWEAFNRDIQIDIPYIEKLLKIKAPKPPRDKCFAACFATTNISIKRTPLTLWDNIHKFLMDGCERTKHILTKRRAIIMEYMWALILNEKTLYDQD